VQRTLDSEVVSYVYVVDAAGRLEAVFSIRDLLKAAPEDRVSDFMSTELIYADVTDDQEKVATLARKYNLNSIPILDKAGVLVGVATIDDILDILSEEADEDIYRMAGTAASQQKVWRRALIRIPWLMMPVVSGFVIAGMHAGNETDADVVQAVGRAITLAAFIPLVMGISGAVGTQTAIMMVRGMATGDVERGRGVKIFFQEVRIGVIIAVAIGGTVTLALIGILRLGMLNGDAVLGPAVGLGLAGGIIIASILGTVFPFGCVKIGLDPALVAGPFITSLNDIVAAAIYLGVAQAVLSIAGS
jgi:magnesium transporter